MTNAHRKHTQIWIQCMNSESGSPCHNMAPPPSLHRQSGQACRSALASKSSHLEPMHSDTPLARENTFSCFRQGWEGRGVCSNHYTHRRPQEHICGYLLMYAHMLCKKLRNTAGCNIIDWEESGMGIQNQTSQSHTLPIYCIYPYPPGANLSQGATVVHDIVQIRERLCFVLPAGSSSVARSQTDKGNYCELWGHTYSWT